MFHYIRTTHLTIVAIILLALDSLSLKANDENLFKEHLLTKDSVRMIFQFIDSKTASKVRTVCKGWKKLADEENEMKNPNFYTTSSLDTIFMQGKVTITPHLKPRLQDYRRVLIINRKALTSRESENFIRLVNLAQSFNQLNDPQEIDPLPSYVQNRRANIRQWTDLSAKSEAYNSLCQFSNDPIDHEEAYDLNMQVNPTQAATHLTKCANPNDIERIKDHYQKKVWNRTTKIEPQESILLTIFSIVVNLFSSID